MGAGVIRRVLGKVRAAGLRMRVQGAYGPLAPAAILFAAVLVRSWALGSKSLWFDETFSVFVSRQPFLDIPRLLSAYDAHPPLYYLLLHAWMRLFGSSETAIRVPSVTISLAVVLLTFLLARRLAGTGVGLLAGVLMAFSPFQVMAAREARMYPFLTAFILAASYALWVALERGRRRHWIAYGACMLLGFYTHNFAFLVAAAHALYVLRFHRKSPQLRAWALALAAAVILYLPWLPSVFPQLATLRSWPNIRGPFTLTNLTDLIGMLSFGGELFGMGTYFRLGVLGPEYRAALLLPFLLLATFGAARLGAGKRFYVLSYLVVPVGVVGLISLWWNIFYQRYFSFVLPPFVILLAAGVFAVADAVQGPRRRAAAVSLLLVVASFNGPALVDLYRAKHAYDWRGAAQHVSAHARADDFILYIPAFARIAFEYYYRGGQQRMSINPGQVLEHRKFRFTTTVDVERMAAIARNHPRMWIVATFPIGYEARMQIAEVMAPHFRETEGKDFGLVYTFLWESRLTTRGGRPGLP